MSKRGIHTEIPDIEASDCYPLLAKVGKGAGYQTYSSRAGDTKRLYNAEDMCQLRGKTEGTLWTKSNSHRLRRAGR
jgi:hypothetical protein